MGNLGFWEVAVVAIVALLVFGPERLPELARQAGRAFARFRQETSKGLDELRRAADLDGLGDDVRDLTSSFSDVKSSLRRELLGGGSDRAPTPVRSDDRPPPSDPEAT